ncbi:uncharacterized protein LOC112341111 [Selaginella moellendorffii]|uniref:CLAVATA3/endosperm surrounding region 3 n=1 Tax=Selaginella moellendorffii TaxID=88036 RepID=C0STN1_SELML|nr:uncharacterized protein LOC112341111 [Selaginella moellendorffii]BAH56534.1 CLAVATA3/endosperm surrounding region 3 [Selaginella moellendorffii]|eukprot:XP_024516393.1 uncharacterized protein LOC112341111 [Selaginella moellendorffii]
MVPRPPNAAILLFLALALILAASAARIPRLPANSPSPNSGARKSSGAPLSNPLRIPPPIDPASSVFGASKRLAPTGPNPLHNR